MIGLFFALRSDEEHRRLCFNPSQIELVEKPGSTSYLLYKEDISKTNQTGLHHRNIAPKEVIQHANKDKLNCIILWHPDNAFYFAPLTHPKENCWFKWMPSGHCKLAEVVPRLMKSASIPGYFTNHSLRVTAAT